MARIPCAFSVQAEFLLRIDARAEELGMKRSEYIVHALRRDLQGMGGAFSVVAEQSGQGNVMNQLSSSPSVPPPRVARTAKVGKKNGAKKRSKKK